MSVTASGNDGNVSANTIDDNLATRWSCFGKGSWIMYDLGSTQNITACSIAWYNGNTRKSNFVISLSVDGNTWSNVFSGSSSGGLSLENYAVSGSGRYVKITVNGNTVNDWASITETKIYGGTTPAPTPSPTPSGGLDVNGVKMIYPSAANGPSYFFNMDSDNMYSSKYIKTDENAVSQVLIEANVRYRRLTSTDVTYASGMAPGKTCRVNLNGGGFIATQAHRWTDSNVAYLWTAADSKNAEFTYYFRAVNNVHPHTTAASKMRSGVHSGSTDPRASCFDIEFKIGLGDSSMEYALEYNHPNYHYNPTTKKSSNLSVANKWIGRKTIAWNAKDGKVHLEDWIDWNPFDLSGKPVNNWTLLQTQIISGDSTYNKVPLWGGASTYRQDGYTYVDIAIISIREIIPPT